MNKVLVSLLIIGAVFIFVLGGGAGVLYQTQKDAPKLDNAEKVIKILASKTVPSIMAYGQVTNIQGKNITLAYSGDSVTLKMRDDAKIYSFVSQGLAKKSLNISEKEEITFSDIKKGDTLNITLKVLPDGGLEGMIAMVLSSPSQSTPK